MAFEVKNDIKRVGIVGYGNLGRFLVNEILAKGEQYRIKLAFVWNRNSSVFEHFPHSSLVLNNLDDFGSFEPNLIVEVSHPDVTKTYGVKFLQHCDYMIGSPSALADEQLESTLRNASLKYGVFVPKGALWGSQDIRSLSKRKQLNGLNIEMRFHPHSLRLEEPLKTACDQVNDAAIVLYKGPVRNVCKLAPNNVNTMACAAVAAECLGFDRVIGTLVADSNALNYHKITIEVLGSKSANGDQFKVITERQSPSLPGCVTSSATYTSFFNSLIEVKHNGPGFHLC